MRKLHVSERWIIMGIALLMLLVLAILARVLGNAQEREQNLSAMLLGRALADQEQRLKLVAETYAKDLRQEATYIRLHPGLSDSALFERWLPLLQDHNAIRTITLADEQGNAWVLDHPDSSWQWQVTKRQDSTIITLVGDPFRRDTMATQRPASTDPRETNWYSKAVESHGMEPVWSEADQGSANEAGGSGVLQVSELLLGNGGPGTLQVLSFSMSGEEMFNTVVNRGPNLSGLVLNGRWQAISRMDTADMGAAWAQVLQDRKNLDLDQPFRPREGDPMLLGRMGPLHLPGTMLHTGVIICVGEVHQLNKQRSVGLWALMGLLTLLSLLLTLVFLQTRGAERREQQQTRRSKQQARHLEKVMTEREMLDREVHHRVKNNLQVVSSLLNLQAQRVPDEGARKEFVRGKRRIDSMALVHHKLYRQNDLSAVDLQEFLNDIAKAMAAMFAPQSANVAHQVEANNIRCNADTSIQLGMILCELLANCHQHAFPERTGGQILITVDRLDEQAFRLVVKDNGQGLDQDPLQNLHLGLEVVEALAEQLDGQLHLGTDGGTRVEVTFRPVEEP